MVQKKKSGKKVKVSNLKVNKETVKDIPVKDITDKEAKQVKGGLYPHPTSLCNGGAGTVANC